MTAATQLAAIVGTVAACAALNVPRSSLYRAQSAASTEPARPRPTPARALSAIEREKVLEVANSDRFVDTAPAEIVATLLDEDTYYCSTRTMYRILADNDEVRERRNQRRHPEYKKPELLATGPNQVWTWDITKLLGPGKFDYYYLYVMLDIYSRYVVGWIISDKENATLAKLLISESCLKQGIEPGDLTIHSDRGSPMTSKTVAQLMSDLEITKSHSRPQVSDDNPFSESHFKTIKYRPEYPGRFDDQDASKQHFREFFGWYNESHRHSGIAYMTPSDVHYGRAADVQAARQLVLSKAYASHPERFVRRPPVAAAVPAKVYINPPKPMATQPVTPPDASEIVGDGRGSRNSSCDSVQPGLRGASGASSLEPEESLSTELAADSRARPAAEPGRDATPPAVAVAFPSLASPPGSKAVSGRSFTASAHGSTELPTKPATFPGPEADQADDHGRAGSSGDGCFVPIAPAEPGHAVEPAAGALPALPKTPEHAVAPTARTLLETPSTLPPKHRLEEEVLH